MPRIANKKVCAVSDGILDDSWLGNLDNSSGSCRAILARHNKSSFLLRKPLQEDVQQIKILLLWNLPIDLQNLVGW